MPNKNSPGCGNCGCNFNGGGGDPRYFLKPANASVTTGGVTVPAVYSPKNSITWPGGVYTGPVWDTGYFAATYAATPCYIRVAAVCQNSAFSTPMVVWKSATPSGGFGANPTVTFGGAGVGTLTFTFNFGGLPPGSGGVSGTFFIP